MSLREAAALSAFGAKVLHADSLAPLARAGFRLVVANTHRPAASRTEIRVQAPARRPGEITSVAYKEGLACLRLPPTRDLEPLFHAALRLQEAGTSRYGLLSTPDGSLLVVRPETSAAEVLLEKLGEGLDLQRGWAVVALVGEGLRAAPGRALGLLSTLQEEPIAGILAGDTGVSLAFLVPETRLASLIPHLHTQCFNA
jgi:aspartate kinase